MLIRCAGFMWHRKYVDWGRRRLLGLSEDGGDQEVDFANQSAVYGLYDSNHQCIYVGQAGKGDEISLYDRLQEHALEDHLFCFWKRFTWFGFYSVEQLRSNQFQDPLAARVTLSETLNTIESAATYLALPRFNRRWGSGLQDVAWYYQPEEYEQAKAAKRRSSAGA